ncbi:MAG TPA: efflux transporter periplasmic adaptor subunit [Opitutae bacterium]|nr:efflux transporter periplasmic adaptor subunit [Opitutae bacterium]
MLKKILFAAALVLSLGLVIFFLVATKGAQFAAMGEASKNAGPWPETVSTFIVEEQSWSNSLQSVGSIEPVQGVTLEAEIPGLVTHINFNNGQKVSAGDLLVQLDVDVEQAQLRSAEATAQLATVELKRSERLLKTGAVTQSQLDRAIADEASAQANVENLKAVIARKTIRAPFSGSLGIRQINLGQYVPQGSPIVSLQSNDQVFVNFTLPQQALASLDSGMTVELQSDVYPQSTFTGEITAISPQVDPITRTVEVQGTLDNVEGKLRAGLFVRVSVKLPEVYNVTVVPSTAILYAPYGNSIFIVEAAKNDAGEPAGLKVRQSLIKIGEKRGDYVSIVKGLEVGEEIVSAGAFKLRNGSSVVVNNDLAPKPEANPTPDNS